jgi:uncharacterized protein (DUF952 family)
MSIYKIFRAPEWEAMRAQGHSLGAPIDLQDGYVHLSTAEQVEETAARHFAGEHGLVLLALDESRLAPDLRWEPSRGGALFPHLYRELRLADVLRSAPPLLGGHPPPVPPL